MSAAKPTLEQRRIAEDLSRQYGIAPDDVHFFKPDEAWLGADALMQIARNHPNIETITESFDQFIQPLNQVVHAALVSLKDGRAFQRTGIAKVEETVSGEKFDGHFLASSRAITSALNAARLFGWISASLSQDFVG